MFRTDIKRRVNAGNQVNSALHAFSYESPTAGNFPTRHDWPCMDGGSAHTNVCQLKLGKAEEESVYTKIKCSGHMRALRST